MLTCVPRGLYCKKEGLPELCKQVNRFNELLYDEIIPRLFTEMYEIEEYDKKETITVQLVKEPKNGDCYYVKYKQGLMASVDDDYYAKYKERSFNVDHYCFDSQPESDMFWNLLCDKRLTKVWFTGMLTNGQTDFIVNYIDPITGGIRAYYPDFLVQKEDGSYVIIEVKGENMIDDAVVQAKKYYAERMASASGFEYIMVPGKKAKEELAFSANKSYL